MRNQMQFGFTSWGGRRPGAGRKPNGARKRVAHTRRSNLKASTPVHVTLRLARGLPSLRAQTNHHVVLDALAAGSKRGFRIVHYAAMSNHVHLVCEAADERALTRGLQGLCVRLARRLNRAWRRLGTVFDDRYHVHPLRTPREVRNALAYVLQNARKHGIHVAGGFDPCSSARWFDGWRSGARLFEFPSPLPAARTWLLNIGWRRWGLFDLVQDCTGRSM